MANPTITAETPDYSRRRRTRRYALAFTAGNYTVGGMPLDLTSILNPNFLGDVLMGTVPSLADMKLVNNPAGYIFEVVAGAGTTLATAFNVKIYTAPGTELTAIAIPAAIIADILQLEINQKAWS